MRLSHKATHWLRASKKRIARKGASHASTPDIPKSGLRHTIMTVLLTFFFTTLGGAILNLWVMENQNETRSAEENADSTLKAYDDYIKSTMPEYEQVEKLSLEINEYSKIHGKKDLRNFVIMKYKNLPSYQTYLDYGDLYIDFGKSAYMWNIAVESQYVALITMMDRRTKSRNLKFDEIKILNYIVGLKESYNAYLMEIARCKKDVSQNFMIYGKLYEIRKCEKSGDGLSRLIDRKIWGPGIFEEPDQAATKAKRKSTVGHP